jgi:ubiquinone/menaquinone biosynthesis C-methylase UbiE
VPNKDRATLDYYNQAARKYREIHRRPIQRYTEAQEKEAFRPYLSPDQRVLDLGCGEGRTTRYLADWIEGPIFGADFSEAMIRVARSYSPTDRINFLVADAMDLSFKQNSLDVVISFTSFNNFPNPRRALEEISRVLKPGGLFLALIINGDEWARWARYVYLAPYYLYLLLKPRSWHRRLFSREEVRRLLVPAFEIIELRGLRFWADFIPEFPFNFWPPLFPLLERRLSRLRPSDERLCRHPLYGRHARFHFVAGRVKK